MSTIKNGQGSLHCHFNKIIKGPGTGFQSAALSQKHVRNILLYSILVFDQVSFWRDLGFRRNKHMCNLHYVAMLNILGKILKSLIVNVNFESWNYCIPRRHRADNTDQNGDRYPILKLLFGNEELQLASD